MATYSTAPDGSGREDDLSPTIDARAKDGPRRNQGGTVIAVQAADDSAATLTKGSANPGVSEPGRRQEDDVNLAVVSYGLGSHAGSLGDATNESHEGGGPVGMGIVEEQTQALRAGRTQAVASGPVVAHENADGKVYESDVAPAIRENVGRDGSGTPFVVDGQEPQTFDWQLGGGGNDDSFRGGSRAWIEDKPGTARALTKNKTLAVYEPAKAEEAVAFNTRQDDQAAGERDYAPPLDGDESGSIAVAISENQRREIRESDHAPSLGVPSGHPGQGLPVVFTKTHGAQDTEDAELWDEAAAARTLNGMAFATDVVVEPGDEVAPTLREHPRPGSNDDGAIAPVAHPGAAVRRLTPRECERLQGFPDDWTLLPGIDVTTADGPRYAALGDAVTVNVPYWVASRLRRRECP